MICSSYSEVAVAMDRAFAAPADQPLPMGVIFASLAPQPSGEPIPPRPPDLEPDIG
jgi:hypothetical protein